MKSPSCLSAVLVLGYVASAAAADKLSLRPHWEVGKTYTLENQTTMTMSIPGLAGGAGGAAGGNDTTMGQTMTITVKGDAATGNKLAEMNVAAIKADMAMMGQKMTYDSKDPAKSAPFLQQSFGALLNKTFTMVYDKDDNFVEVRGLESLSKGTPLGQNKVMNGEQMAGMFRKSFEMSLPKDPVDVGDTWNFEDKIELGPMGAMAFKISGKFDSVVDRDGHKHARLLLTGTFSSPEAGGKPLVKLGEGSKLDGEVFYDLDRKIVDYSETHSDLKLDMGGQELPMKQTTITKISSVIDTK